MGVKTWEIIFKYHHHLTGLLLLVSLLAAALYLTHDFDYWKFVKNQFYVEQEDLERRQQVTNNHDTPRCDLFSGTWIYDNKSYYPLYKETECSFMEHDFACERHGRKDLKYQRWRWQPHHCDIPRLLPSNSNSTYIHY